MKNPNTEHIENLRMLYKENNEFREYCQKTADSRKITVDEVLTLAMTRSYVECMIERYELEHP